MEKSVDVVVVGAGFAGMYMLHRMRGEGRTVQVFEAGADVGGTWYWNRYPGARCDVESMEYSYSFDEDLQQEWEWSEKYAPQPEILRYAQHVADRFDLRRDIRFSTRVVSAKWDADRVEWTVGTDRGDTVRARWFVLATGCLSSTNKPEFPGQDLFTGESYHTGDWPHEGVDFTGKRVVVIGTGSSGVQSIPLIAQQAEHLTVLQRTATYCVPARNSPIDRSKVSRIKSAYREYRERNRQMTSAFGAETPKGTGSVLQADPAEREAEFERRWATGGFGFLSSYVDFLLRPEANEIVADFVRRKIADTVRDPRTARLLQPTNVIGCKRLVLDTGYYETFNRPNVTLVDVGAEPIERLTERGIFAGGTEHPADAIVYATGFDAMTGSILRISITGKGGTTLADAWAAGPATYLGLSVAGFPNMFVITGPGSPSVLTNMIMSIEQHVDWITGCMRHVDSSGARTIEAEPAHQEAWVQHVNNVSSGTLYPSCNSWYLGANVPGKPRVFMPLIGFPQYVERCAAVAQAGYEGFTLAPA